MAMDRKNGWQAEKGFPRASAAPGPEGAGPGCRAVPVVAALAGSPYRPEESSPASRTRPPPSTLLALRRGACLDGRVRGVPPVRPAQIVIPGREAEPLEDEGVDRGAAAPLAVGDDRFSRHDADRGEPGAEGGLVEEPAVGVDEVRP